MVDRTIRIEESCEKGATLLFGCSQVNCGNVLVMQETERTQAASHTRMPSIYGLTILVINRIQVWMALQGSDGVTVLLYLVDEGWISGCDLVAVGTPVAKPDAKKIWCDSQVRVW